LRPANALRLALPRHVYLDGLDATVARAFGRALDRLRGAGVQVVETAIDGLADMSEPAALAGIVAAEAWAWHRDLLQRRGDEYDPRVAARIRRGESIADAELHDLRRRRTAWQQRVARSIDGFDAVIAPTVPIVAPPLAPLDADVALFTTTNLLILRNPSTVNQLDGCAISLPCHAPDELPVGLMLYTTAHRDDALLDAALAVERTLADGSDR
jgi:Asp-tRNA(Asn)/Glu-tRNA(Gln) amidotransferase A subunit family amidase